MTTATATKKDYVSHHLPMKMVKNFVSDKDNKTSIAEPVVYTTTPNPAVTRKMTFSRKIAAGLIVLGHFITLWCIYDLCFNLPLKSAINWFLATWFTHFFTGISGITAGAHRLWAHRAYKAKLPARLILAFCNSVANQSSILHWAMEHRVHHRHVDTDADPHNINRGFWHCHMGWLFVPRTDAFAAARKEIDDSDLKADPVVYYQDKYYAFFGPVCCYVIPGLLGLYFGGDYWRGVAYMGFFRWVITLHITWCVNSVAHTFGTRPYRPDEKATEIAPVSFFSGGTYLYSFCAFFSHYFCLACYNQRFLSLNYVVTCILYLVSWILFCFLSYSHVSLFPIFILFSCYITGEGWHNYHHAFPWDYAASEDRTDIFWRYNVARTWIDTFAKLGWVYDRKVQRNAWGTPISTPEEATVPADFKPHSH